MMITILEGQATTFPAERGTKKVAFTLRGGRTFTTRQSFSPEAAEQLCCSICLLHPDVSYFLNSEEWK